MGTMSVPGSNLPVNRKAGRPPVELSKDQIETALALTADGCSLVRIAQQIDVAMMTLWRTLRSPEHCGEYAHAREIAARMNEDEVADVTSDTLAGKIEPDAARVGLAGLQWLAKVRDRKRYGDDRQADPPPQAEALNVEALLGQLAAMEKQTGLFARLGVKLEQTTTLTVAAQVSTLPDPDKPA